MKQLGIFLLPPGWDASPSQGYPSIKFAGTQLYTWLERGTVRVKCLAHERNAMTLARAQTQTARKFCIILPGWFDQLVDSFSYKEV